MNEVNCTSCGGTNIIEDKSSGELICVDCGNVIDKVIYPDPEWRAYSYGDRVKRERTGAPTTPLLHDLGLSTRCRAYFKEVYSGRDRMMIKVLSEIYRISSSLNIPQCVAQTAAVFLRKIDESSKFSRIYLRSLPASLLYLSLKAHGIPRDLRELAEAAGTKQELIRRCYLKLSKSMNIRGSINADAYISKIVRILRLPGEVERLANQIYAAAALEGFTQGKNRKAMAAASVYLAAKNFGIPLSQRSLVSEVGVSGNSLKRRIREFKAVLTDGDIRRKDQSVFEEDKSCRKS
ncbi:MAG: transcription initiation factor IIB family protein [Nitrososphaeria archaeon]|nr:transcription initiation factor IIB family protein [Aigarchaeota archaeon]MCX8187397.1 transcription initiation factor IIB family protein [Nitrososphaeria archaeon]MDW8021806.1 transcription initiation factor IIB family protein [Nitrososphaerota archaeon]